MQKLIEIKTVHGERMFINAAHIMAVVQRSEQKLPSLLLTGIWYTDQIVEPKNLSDIVAEVSRELGRPRQIAGSVHTSSGI